MRECPTALIQCPNCREYSMVPEEDYRVTTEVKQEPLDELAVHTRCLKCGDVHKFYKQAWNDVPYLYESDIKIAMCPRCRKKTAHFTMVKAEDKKKSHQLLCPNCEATIIKENGQICDGVAWRVGVPNEKVELRCSYCNHSVIISIKDIVDERIKGKTDE
jgi:RNase P subunit RPR2